MAWPVSSVVTDNVDESTDSPTQARANIYTNFQNVNDIIDSRAATNGIASLDGSGYVPAAQLGLALLKVGGTVSGDIILTGGTPSNVNGVVPKSYVDAIAPGAGSIGTAQLQDDAVTGAKMAHGTITATNLAVSAVGTSNIADGNITEAKLQNSSVSVNKLATNSVSNTKYQSLSITNGKIANATISQSKLASNSVGISQIKFGSGSVSGALVTTFAVHQYAFASPWASWDTGASSSPPGWTIGYSNVHATIVRYWVGLSAGTFAWDYLTGSENSDLWLIIAPTGEIMTSWEAEDPVNDLFPDEPVIDMTPEQKEQGLRVINARHVFQSPAYLQGLRTLSAHTYRDLPQWAQRSKHKDERTCQDLTNRLAKDLFAKRGVEMPPSIDECCGDSTLKDSQHIWRTHLWARVICMVQEEDAYPVEIMVKHLRKHFKYINGHVELK
jgi:hypothetical protein